MTVPNTWGGSWRPKLPSLTVLIDFHLQFLSTISPLLTRTVKSSFEIFHFP